MVLAPGSWANFTQNRLAENGFSDNVILVP